MISKEWSVGSRYIGYQYKKMSPIFKPQKRNTNRENNTADGGQDLQGSCLQ